MVQTGIPAADMRAGAALPVDLAGSLIARSRRRSIDLYHLDPGSTRAPQVLSASALRERRAPMEPWLDVAHSGMETLFQQIRDAGYFVVLADAQAVAVDVMTNPALGRELQGAGLYPGSCWSEDLEGTCAIGMAVVDRHPITVHHGEHFRASNHKLTCSAAPIFAPDGRLIAVLDASALHSPDDKRSQHLVLQMVGATARLIEDARFLRRYEHHLVLRLGNQPDFLEIAPHGLIALEDDGRIVAVNQRFLADTGQLAAQLVGRHFEQVFNSRFEEVAAVVNRAATPAVALRLLHSGSQCFALPRAPRTPRIAAPDACANASLRSGAAALAALAGGDARMTHNIEQAMRVLDKGLPVLLLGESGTGKEAFAKAMHDASSRSRAAFVALNCAAIPDTLVEAELFGYRDGAFTGARAKGSRGKIAQAHGGTLFLDEIGDMPLPLQTRLLRVLAEHEVTPLGAEQPISVDMQVICATHRNLKELVAHEAFRLDLYYRLNGLALELPPLRERTDKEALLDAILRDEARRIGRVSPSITCSARSLLLEHDWPGNIRQMTNALRAALALAGDEPIGIEHLPADIADTIRAALPPSRLTSLGFNETPEVVRETNSERDALLCALRAHRWNVTRTACSLDVCRATVYRRMERHHIVAPNRRE